MPVRSRPWEPVVDVVPFSSAEICALEWSNSGREFVVADSEGRIRYELAFSIDHDLFSDSFLFVSRVYSLIGDNLSEWRKVADRKFDRERFVACKFVESQRNVRKTFLICSII